MKLKTAGLALALAWGSVASTAQAHHSPFSLDITREVQLKGILRSVDYVNPHSHFTLDVKDSGGKTVTWDFESNPPGWFRKAKINRADFAKAIGDEVTITASIAKDGRPFGLLKKMTFKNGATISIEVSN